MAKGGARKKTKWVSLSLASSTSTFPPAANEVDRSLKSIRQSTFATNKPANIESRGFHHSTSERRSVAGSDVTRPRRNQIDGNSSLYTNGHHINRSQPVKSFHNNYFSGSGSGRKSQIFSHNSSDSYTGSLNGKCAANAKKVSCSTATINEDEYTKITTPRQDVLFKKGYLTRPKMQTGSATTMTSETGIITASSSVNGTTDGSDAATRSGSASTAESVTSDSTYLTDSHFMEYPATYPYFGYFDQSGVLVMNGFAIDNNGFSYMNGGQTYIYPPNYHCQQSPVDSTIQTNEINVAAVDGTHHCGDGETAEGGPEEIRNILPAEEDISTVHQQTDANENILSSEPEIIKQHIVEDVEYCDELDQHVPQQQQQLQYAADGYDCAQFYNTFYYPGCVIAPFPVFPNGMYVDQYEEESARQAGFRKRKKRYRGWEEHPVEISLEGTSELLYPEPTYYYTEELVPSEQIDMTEHDTCLENSVDAIPPHSFLESEENLSNNDLPTCVPEDRSPQPTNSNLSVSEKPKSGSHSKPQPQIILGTKPKSQKSHKKALIEATRAFAEQNIDLSRPASWSKSSEIRHNESNTWRTVRHGKEIVFEEDKELRHINTSTMSKMDPIKEIPETHFNDECSLSTNETCSIEPPVAVASTVTMNECSKTTRRETILKKTKKGKGKKMRKTNPLQQQKGFEVIEPDFSLTVQNKFKGDLLRPEIVEDQEACLSLDNSSEAPDESEFPIVKENIDTQKSTTETNSYLFSNTETNINETLSEDDLERELNNIHISDIKIEDVIDDISSANFSANQCMPEGCELSTNNVGSAINNVPFNTSCHEESPTGYPTTSLDINLAAVQSDTCTAAASEDDSERLVSSVSGDDITEYDDQISRHFPAEEYSENVDSGLQSPAAFIPTNSEERKSSSSSYNSQEMHVTDAVTKWLSETLSDKRLEEMFILPKDPSLIQRINQYNLLGLDILSDSYSSSSGDEAEDADSDYMSDVQGRKHPNSAIESNQKTEIQKDQLNKQTANGHVPVTSNHSNHKQKRCIIM